jgi:hypothetical protein
MTTIAMGARKLGSAASFVGWVRRIFLRRNPTIVLGKWLGYATLTQPTWILASVGCNATRHTPFLVSRSSVNAIRRSRVGCGELANRIR